MSETPEKAVSIADFEIRLDNALMRAMDEEGPIDPAILTIAERRAKSKRIGSGNIGNDLPDSNAVAALIANKQEEVDKSIATGSDLPPVYTDDENTRE